MFSPDTQFTSLTKMELVVKPSEMIITGFDN